MAIANAVRGNVKTVSGKIFYPKVLAPDVQVTKTKFLPEILDGIRQQAQDAMNTALGNAHTETVDNIAARDALAKTKLDKYPTFCVLVTDASADETVTSGAACYYYDKSGSTEGNLRWVKLYEGSKLQLTTLWNKIEGVPEVLTKLDANSDGALTYDGKVVSEGKRSSAVVQSGDETPTNLYDDGFYLQIESEEVPDLPDDPVAA